MKRLFTLFLLTCACLHLTSCEKTSRSESGVLCISLSSDPRTLDPRTGGDGETSLLLGFLFDGLLQLDKEGMPVLAAAKSVTLSKDCLTYTFKLAKTYWSNGEKVTAYDFEYAWKSALDPNFMTDFSSFMDPIKGAKRAKAGEISLDEVGIEVLDKETLVVHLEHPAPYFLESLTLAPFKPICKSVALKDPKWMNKTGHDYICNGAFTLKEWQHGSQIIFEKNPRYWDRKTIHMQEIQISMLDNPTAQLALLEQGDLDWVGYPFGPLPMSAIEQIRKIHRVESINLPFILMLTFNTKAPLLNSVHLRKALSIAVDRQALADSVTQGEGGPVYSMLPPSLSLHQAPLFDDKQTNLASEHLGAFLNEMSLEKENIPKLRMLVPSDTYQKIAEVIQQNWLTKLGFNVSIEQVEWKTFFDRITHSDYEIGMLGWISGLNDPIYNLNIYRDSTNLNLPQWVNKDFHDLLDLSDETMDISARKEYLKQAEKLLMDHMPIAPLVYYKGLYIKRPNLKGVHTTPQGEVIMKQAYFEEASK